MRTIALLSFKEILYKRIFLITFLMTLAFLTFYGVANHFAADNIAQEMSNGGNTSMEKMQLSFMSSQFLNVGLYFSSFITALLAILATVGSISLEIENHQIDTLLARPLRRSSVVLGKFLGLGVLMLAYATFLFAGILLVNHVFGGLVAAEVSLVNALRGGMYFAMQPLVIIAAALWLSSRMSTINGGVVLIILYVTSFIGGFLEQIGAITENTALINIGILSSLLFPTDSLFRKMTGTLMVQDDSPLAFVAQGPFSNLSEPSNLMIAYAVLYALLALFFAARKFAKRDV
ncbi:MAG: ABC transporter permease subunit [Tumebacillaceae bacterium]